MKALTLRKIPDDVSNIILEEQKKEKQRRRQGMFGFEQTIYKIIRDYERCRKSEERNNGR